MALIMITKITLVMQQLDSQAYISQRTITVKSQTWDSKQQQKLGDIKIKKIKNKKQ